MLARLLVLTILAGFVAVPASAQTLPCVSQATDPCVISTTATIPVGVYDIRPKSLAVGNKQITVSGAGELKILAANITFLPGARFIATGTDGNTTVTLDATGFIDIQSQGTSKSKIDVSGNFGGGTINLHSVGNLSVNGPLTSNATNLLGFGGPINVKSETGNVTITGDPSEGLRSFGNSQGGGGSISIDAPLGSINVSTQLVPKGGDCGSCEVNLTAGVDITTTAQGVIDMRASGVGDGGFASVSADGNVNMAGNILANGSSDDMDGGTGGDVLISAGGSVTMSGRVELNGAGQDAALNSTGFSVDGDSGSVDISATGAIQITGPMFGIAKGFGQGDEFSIDAGGNVTMGGEIDMTADNFAGDITVLSDLLITVSARLRTAAPVDVGHPAALGGTIDIEGCQINVTAAGQLVATGPGGAPSGSNLLVASTGLTMAGSMIATDLNELDYRTSVPSVTGTAIPPVTAIEDLNLPCCGVQCPTTTTTTTTTSTTHTTSTSTSSSTSTSTSSLAPTTTSSAPVPTTTTSTVVIPTTTSSTGPVPTTTSSTSAPSSSTTSTSKAPTTTTSSTAAPTTTTSSTAAPTTTTSSTAAPTTTTSSTVAPTTTTSSTIASTTTTSQPGATTTSSTAVTTTSSTSTLPTTTSTNASTTSTTSSTSVIPTSSTVVTTSTAPVPTTSTTEPPLGCLDTATGIDAVRCRLDLLTEELSATDPQNLGGANLARALTNNLAKATKYTTDPTSPKRLKKAATQLKKFAAKVGRAISKGKIDATFGNDLVGLATDARSQLLGLGAS